MTLAKLLLVVPFLCQYAVAAESTMMVDNFRQLISTSGIDGAIEQYRKQPNSDRQQLHYLANELLDQQMFDDALRIFQLNAEFFPDDWKIRKSLAAAHYELQHYRLALVNYQQALNILEASAPGSDKREGLLKKIAKIYRKLGNYYAALYIYQLEIARDPGADWAVQKIGQWMLKYGNRKVGIRWLKRATDMQGSPDRAWQKLGNYYKKRSSYRYVRHLREGLNRFPYLAASWDRLAYALLDDYRALEAERIVAEALTLFQADSLWRTARTQQGRELIARYAQKLNGLQFTAMGCGPYYQEDAAALKHYMKIENAFSASKFIIHLGDIGKGVEEVPESRYADMADMLGNENGIPTFVVLGDNDWNDSSNPAQSLSYWKRYLGNFYRHFKLPFSVMTQPQREENFSFELGDVVYVGINLPEGRVHDEAEWRIRIHDNGVWIEHSLAVSNAKAAVIMAHAPADVFDGQLLKSLRESAVKFGKPLLFLHANGHKWVYHKSDWAANIIHVQLNKLHSEEPGYPPVQIRYTGREDLPFVFDRRIGSPVWRVE